MRLGGLICGHKKGRAVLHVPMLHLLAEENVAVLRGAASALTARGGRHAACIGRAAIGRFIRRCRLRRCFL